MPAVAVVCVALGAGLIAVAVGWLPIGTLRAPAWGAGAAGGVLVLAGAMVFVGQQSRWNELFAGLLCSLFALVGLWVALRAPDAGRSGGMPLIGMAANAWIARLLFGSGALLSAWMATLAFKGFLRR